MGRRKSGKTPETGQCVTGGDVVLGFGRHKGKKLSRVSDNYLVWCIKNMESGSATWKMIKGEVKRRDDLDAARGRCGRVSRCPENERAENQKVKTSFIVLTGQKSTVHRPDSVCVPGDMSPFGIRYPSDWAKLTKGQRKAWNKHAAGLQAASKPKEATDLASIMKSKSAIKPKPVKPVLSDDAIDTLIESQFANVALSKLVNRQPSLRSLLPESRWLRVLSRE